MQPRAVKVHAQHRKFVDEIIASSVVRMQKFESAAMASFSFSARLDKYRIEIYQIGVNMDGMGCNRAITRNLDQCFGIHGKGGMRSSMAASLFREISCELFHDDFALWGLFHKPSDSSPCSLIVPCHFATSRAYLRKHVTKPSSPHVQGTFRELLPRLLC
ncbi:hypothetical protein L284_13735 [Novosphingobium lindaniclasticum LE124]|uniref:Uncharacterized protein n=1 Tax=Novosphingobium lindaniclasticum LE124 TaxID=1096930 RepID=T0HLK9_9SPHN|nr:hypothetical protein L284_13735 [Novosphingobium lindaniclasticum LE124]